jgi:hypothetical protein
MSVKPDGTIVIGGSNGYPRKAEMVTASPQGKVTRVVQAQLPGVGSVPTEILSQAISPGGKIVAVGQVDTSLTQHQGFVTRFNANLTVDRTFGKGGFVMTTLSGQPAVASHVFVQPDGKAVIQGGDPAPGYWVGYCRCGTFMTFIFEEPTAVYMNALDVLRLNRNGKPDPSFGDKGWALVPTGPSWPKLGVSGFALQQPGHRIILAYPSFANPDTIALLGKARRVKSSSH